MTCLRRPSPALETTPPPAERTTPSRRRGGPLSSTSVECQTRPSLAVLGALRPLREQSAHGPTSCDCRAPERRSRARPSALGTRRASALGAQRTGASAPEHRPSHVEQEPVGILEQG